MQTCVLFFNDIIIGICSLSILQRENINILTKRQDVSINIFTIREELIDNIINYLLLSDDDTINIHNIIR